MRSDVVEMISNIFVFFFGGGGGSSTGITKQLPVLQEI